MSLGHPEEHRCCTRCGHTWFAEKWGRLDTGHLVSQRVVDMRRTHYRQCPNCGSTKITKAAAPRPVIRPTPVHLMSRRQQKKAAKPNDLNRRQRKLAAKRLAAPPTGPMVG